jgi:hypothetical protein
MSVIEAVRRRLPLDHVSVFNFRDNVVEALEMVKAVAIKGIGAELDESAALASLEGSFSTVLSDITAGQDQYGATIDEIALLREKTAKSTGAIVASAFNKTSELVETMVDGAEGIIDIAGGIAGLTSPVAGAVTSLFHGAADLFRSTQKTVDIVRRQAIPRILATTKGIARAKKNGAALVRKYKKDALTLVKVKNGLKETALNIADDMCTARTMFKASNEHLRDIFSSAYVEEHAVIRPILKDIFLTEATDHTFDKMRQAVEGHSADMVVVEFLLFFFPYKPNQRRYIFLALGDSAYMAKHAGDIITGEYVHLPRGWITGFQDRITSAGLSLGDYPYHDTTEAKAAWRADYDAGHWDNTTIGDNLMPHDHGFVKRVRVDSHWYTMMAFIENFDQVYDSGIGIDHDIVAVTQQIIAYAQDVDNVPPWWDESSVIAIAEAQSKMAHRVNGKERINENDVFNPIAQYDALLAEVTGEVNTYKSVLAEVKSQIPIRKFCHRHKTRPPPNTYGASKLGNRHVHSGGKTWVQV